MMKAEEVVIAWVPNRGQYLTHPACGKVIVFVPPENPVTQQFTHTIGANTMGWKHAGVSGRRAWMQATVTEMLTSDKIEPDVIRSALCKVDEWVSFPFSTETSM